MDAGLLDQRVVEPERLIEKTDIGSFLARERTQQGAAFIVELLQCPSEVSLMNMYSSAGQ